MILTIQNNSWSKWVKLEFKGTQKAIANLSGQSVPVGEELAKEGRKRTRSKEVSLR